MSEHVHGGVYNFLFAGISAVIFINLLKFIAIWADDKPGFDWVTRMIGGAISTNVEA